MTKPSISDRINDEKIINSLGKKKSVIMSSYPFRKPYFNVALALFLAFGVVHGEAIPSPHRSLAHTVLKVAAITCMVQALSVVTWRFAVPALISQYPLNITIPEATPGKDHAVVTLHGWGDAAWNKWGIETPQFLPTIQPIYFDFSDAGVWHYPILLRYSSFGQDTDLTRVLKLLIMLHEKGYKKISLLGHSRGGATGITTLDALQNPENYRACWIMAGAVTMTGQLNHRLIRSINKKLKAAPQCFTRPLLSVPVVCEYHFGRRWAAFAQKIIGWITSYDPNQTTPLEKLQTMVITNRFPYQTYIQYSLNDDIIGTQTNKDLIELAARSHGKIEVTASYFDHSNIVPELEKFPIYKKKGHARLIKNVIKKLRLKYGAVAGTLRQETATNP